MEHEHHSDCIFCSALKKEDGPENLIIYRGKLAFVIFNLYPYTNGHVMVAACDHRASLEDLDQETRIEIMDLLAHTVEILRKVYNPEGFNIGVNIGAAAGAGVVGHIHFHVVPRWGGDANFMSTISETRVLPEMPEESYSRIKSAWE